MTIFPTVRSAGISTEGDGWLHVVNNIERTEMSVDNKKIQNCITEGCIAWLSHTGEAPQAGDRHQHQSQIEFCHLCHQRGRKEPSMHQLKLPRHWNE